jgi:hypothetical protein
VASPASCGNLRVSPSPCLPGIPQSPEPRAGRRLHLSSASSRPWLGPVLSLWLPPPLPRASVSPFVKHAPGGEPAVVGNPASGLVCCPGLGTALRGWVLAACPLPGWLVGVRGGGQLCGFARGTPAVSGHHGQQGWGSGADTSSRGPAGHAPEVRTPKLESPLSTSQEGRDRDSLHGGTGGHHPFVPPWLLSSRAGLRLASGDSPVRSPLLFLGVPPPHYTTQG